MKHRSDLFKIGDRLPKTLLTITGSVNPTNWREVVCLCDCGTEVVLPYQVAYTATQYSCGCARRIRRNAADFTGLIIYGSGRKLEVLGFEKTTGRWQYLCDCCSEVFFVPQGNERGVERTLRAIAGKPCPNFRRFWECQQGEVVGEPDMLMNTIEFEMNRTPDRSHVKMLGKDRYAKFLEPFYSPWLIKRWPGGKIQGFLGLPDKPLTAPSWKPWIQPKLEQTDADPDGFGAVPELQALDASWPSDAPDK